MTETSTTSAHKSHSKQDKLCVPSEQTLEMLRQYAASVSIFEHPHGETLQFILN